MQATQGIRSRRSWLYSPWVFFLLLFFVVILARGAYGAHNKQNLSASARISLEREIADLEARKKDMQNEVSRLQSSEGVDNELREKFQVVRPGEEMIVIKTSN